MWLLTKNFSALFEQNGGEFQPSFETVHPGGGAYLFSEYILFSN